MLVQSVGVYHARHPALAALTLVLMAQQILVGNDIGPVVTTRVMHAQQYLAETRQAGKCFQRLGRQRGNPKHDYPRRQPWGCLFEGPDALDETLVDTGAALGHALCTDVQQQGAP
ncbi:hypothetical protein D3C80_1192370 [compost metagenome]